MRLPVSDWMWACIAAGCLFGFAAFIIFVIRLVGFEEQIVWFLAFLPGSIPTALFSESVRKLVPSAGRIVYWVLFISFNFGWYWAISYSAIKLFKTFRMGGWRVGPPEF